MKCVLHIGTEKTGSTALQSFLNDHREQLSRRGIHFCASMGQRNNRLLAQAMMRAWRSDDFFQQRGMTDVRARKAWRRSVMASFRQEVASVSAHHHTFLISSEHFHSRLAARGEISMLVKCLKSLFDELEVVCYLRRQDRMAISLYSTVLKAGHAVSTMLPMDDSLPRTRYYFDYEKLLNRWADAAGNAAIQPRIYDEAEKLHGGVVQDFLDHIEATLDAPEKRERRVNRSLSAEAQAVLAWANSGLDAREPSEARELRRELIRRLLQLAPGKPALPPRGEVLEFMRYYDDSNRRCAQRWFGRESLFDGDYAEYPDDGYSGDADRIAELIRKCERLLETR